MMLQKFRYGNPQLYVHLFIFQGKTKAAREAYEKFLQIDNLPPNLKATALRQLGMCDSYFNMYFCDNGHILLRTQW